MSILDAIGAEIALTERQRADADQRLARLRHLEQLAGELDGELHGGGPVVPIAELEEPAAPVVDEPAQLPPPGAPTAPAPARRPAPMSPVARGAARDTEAKVLHALLNANGWRTRAQIQEAAGLEEKTTKRILQALVADGRAIAEGSTRSRRYRAGKVEAHTEARARTDATMQRNASAVLDATAKVGLRERIRKAIAANPGMLNPDELAHRLDATTEDVDEQIAKLIETGHAVATGTGHLTSTRNGRQAVAA